MMHTEDKAATTAFWVSDGDHLLIDGEWVEVENVTHHDNGWVTIEFVGNRVKWENLLPDHPVYYYAGE